MGIRACAHCGLYFGDGDIESHQFNPVTNWCLDCTRRDTVECFGVSYDVRDMTCASECDDAVLCRPICEALKADSRELAEEENESTSAFEAGVNIHEGDRPAITPDVTPENDSTTSASKIVTIGAAKPTSYRVRSVKQMKPGSLGYEAHAALVGLTVPGKTGPVRLSALVEEVQRRCPGKLRGKRPETTLYPILRSLAEVEHVGKGEFALARSGDGETKGEDRVPAV